MTISYRNRAKRLLIQERGDNKFTHIELVNKINELRLRNRDPAKFLATMRVEFNASDRHTLIEAVKEFYETVCAQGTAVEPFAVAQGSKDRRDKGPLTLYYAKLIPRAPAMRRELEGKGFHFKPNRVFAEPARREPILDFSAMVKADSLLDENKYKGKVLDTYGLAPMPVQDSTAIRRNYAFRFDVIETPEGKRLFRIVGTVYRISDNKAYRVATLDDLKKCYPQWYARVFTLNGTDGNTPIIKQLFDDLRADRKSRTTHMPGKKPRGVLPDYGH